MKRMIQKSLLQYVIRHRNGYLIVALGSLILNLLLSITLMLMIGHERIILVPPSIDKTFWVSASHVSPEYLSEMSLFFSNLRFNITPTNATTQRELLLRYVQPNKYEELKTELLSEADYLVKEHISTAFFPVNVIVDSKKLVGRVTGDLQSTIGDSQLPAKRVTYQIAFNYNAGRLFVISFDEVKNG